MNFANRKINRGKITIKDAPKIKPYNWRKARRIDMFKSWFGFMGAVVFVASACVLYNKCTSTALAEPGPLCGNGRVDPGENCTTCPEDVQCDECYKCIGPDCVFIGCPDDCGNGRIDPGENCITCLEDMGCTICDSCVGMTCIPDPLCLCGNGMVDPGENCENCSIDVQCDGDFECDPDTETCEPICGNGVPDPGENCLTCPEDVKCGAGKICFEGECIVKCNPIVEAMEVIFLFDTSGSMIDESDDLCASLNGIEEGLISLGLDVTIKVWGLAPGIFIPCLEAFANQYGPLHNEDWGPGTGLVAMNYPWKTVARILVPISDEGPYHGDPCTTQIDEDSILWAIDIANEYDVIVSPIMGTVWGINQEECIESFGRQLANGTGGTWYFTEGVVMEDLVLNLIQATLCGCSGDLDGDGVVGIKDFLILLSTWGIGGDVDGDGDSDAIDILLMFNQWGDCA